MVQRVKVDVLMNNAMSAYEMRRRLEDVVRENDKYVIDANAIVLVYDDSFVQKFKRLMGKENAVVR